MGHVELPSWDSQNRIPWVSLLQSTPSQSMITAGFRRRLFCETVTGTSAAKRVLDDGLRQQCGLNRTSGFHFLEDCETAQPFHNHAW